MTSKRILAGLALLIAALGALWFPEWSTVASDDGAEVLEAPSAIELDAPAAARTGPATQRSAVGFTSKAALRDHFAKHGSEFGDITIDEYLERAQALRDAELGASVLEAVRDDDVRTRFDRRSGAFLAFHADKKIRTFFIPKDGEEYFRRQLETEH